MQADDLFVRQIDLRFLSDKVTTYVRRHFCAYDYVSQNPTKFQTE